MVPLNSIKEYIKMGRDIYKRIPDVEMTEKMYGNLKQHDRMYNYHTIALLSS